MAIGLGTHITKDTVNQVAGQLALDLCDTMQRIEDFKAWLDQTPDVDIEALGFSAQEVATIKSAFTDQAELVAIFRGAATLAQPKEFTAFLRLLWGFGRK